MMRPSKQFRAQLGVLVALVVVVGCAGTPTSGAHPTSTTSSIAPSAGEEGMDKSQPAAAPSTTLGVGSALVWAEVDEDILPLLDRLIATGDGYVAYSTEEGLRAFTSADGLQWTEQEVVISVTEDLFADDHTDISGSDYPYSFGVEYLPGSGSAPPGFSALATTDGANQRLFVSIDGFRWIQDSMDLEPPILEAPDAEEYELEAALRAPNGPVLIGSTIVEYYDESHAADVHAHQTLVWVQFAGEETWTLVPDPFGVETHIAQLVTTQAGLVALGFTAEGEPMTWTTHDGVTWDPQQSGSELEGFQTHPAVARWGRRLVAAGFQPDAGMQIWSSVDGIDWSALPGDPGVEDTEDQVAVPYLIAAGPYGIVVQGVLETAPPVPPDIVLEKGGLTLTLTSTADSARFSLVTSDSREVVGEGSFTDDECARWEDDFSRVVFCDPTTSEDWIGLRIDEDADGATFFDPDTNADIFTYTNAEIEEARLLAYEQAGIPLPEQADYQGTEVLWFSPDGETWTMTSIGEIVESGSVDEILVGPRSVLLRIPQEESQLILVGTIEESP